MVEVAMMELKTIAVREDGCFSVLLWDGRPFAVSVERTFEDGRPVIGNGWFVCKRSFFHRGGYETFEIIVPRHSEVKFHKGNLEIDSLGCILVAESFAVMHALTAVADSERGFKEFIELTKNHEEFLMTVTGRP